MKILCICGESGSGKNVVMEYLLHKYSRNFSRLVTHTTRDKRDGEINGIDYIFTKENIDDIMNNENVIENRIYYTSNISSSSEVAYYTTKDSIDENKDTIYVTPAVPDQYNSYINYFGQDRVMLMYINCDPLIRLRRSIDRYASEPAFAKRNKYAKEICRRYISDYEDYNEFRKSIGEEYIIQNRFYLEDLYNETDRFIKNNNLFGGK